MPKLHDPADLERTVDSLLRELVAHLRADHGIDLTLGRRARTRLLLELAADLPLDDEGVARGFENMLRTPLDQALLTHRPARPGPLTITDLAREFGTWTASLA
ncbi:hypothetical protein MXD61_24050 [Frankia sp. AgPm24]|uniref:hypothetical protein n=1 Tax=Frankia sp. AgPm24 TaxID=631128 RepID=UPI00200F3D6A|nr:hypothetical protein [Frankia sp. AgPm24]MCK9924903.1 hypothetical protein [Frankia sp. AgPm24]